MNTILISPVPPNLSESCYATFTTPRLPKRRPDPPQCHNCQKYGHTRNYCHHYPRCVKCESEHSTDECTKQPEEPAKCANCSGNHTANYKGCQSLEKILNQTKPKAKAKI
ncbi:Uncharacterized protein FWK35_00027517 [Aphis craccivora]|uniref:Nucleic-acid-binding protein from transposon X-element n=1 Tax=Aphis craccivora TaxID=307492 RepID=A0A6G0Y0T1_APHCR|nr:Uncharacterized protein FWK35_00027517 [Aphis craccivora]